jgi:hypothetical protein
MSKSGKSAYFCHILANNLFLGTFLKIFNRFEIGAKFCVFRNIVEFLKKNNFLL